jgi:hypothetical protein
MFYVNHLAGMMRRACRERTRPRQRPHRFPSSQALRLEALEDRLCPSGGYLLVSSFGNNSVLRYDETTGSFVDAFVPMNSGGLRQPTGLVLGPDHNLYVVNGVFSGKGNQKVLRYDGTTGAFIDDFADDNQFTSPRSVLFGPDGNLYVDNDDNGLGTVLRYNGTTGAFMDDFVPTSSGGLSHPVGMVFGPDGQGDGKLDLYVSSAGTNSILRYDGTTGAFLGAFVPSGSGGLNHPRYLVFGPDANLYVSSGALSGSFQTAVLRFEGPNGPAPGAFFDTFVPAGSGGLNTSVVLLFGPDGKGDGKQDLYVGSYQVKGKDINVAVPGTSEVLRYDGTTGAFVNTFVTPDSGGLQLPMGLTFTETNPTTLNFNGGTTSTSTVLAQPASPASLAAAASEDTALSIVSAATPAPMSLAPALPIIILAPAPSVSWPAHRPASALSGAVLDRVFADYRADWLSGSLGVDLALTPAG